MAKDIVDIAISEIGYKEEGGNKTKYGKWYGMNGAAWCHMFVSWCASQAGVSSDIVPKTASTTAGMEWFKKKGLFQYKGKYTPKRGDIIYFKSSGASHVGIVERVEGSTVHTVEGNTSDKVARRSYALSAARITGYGVPKYAALNTSGSSGSSAGAKGAKKGSSDELKFLKKLLEKKAPETTVMTREAKETNKLPKGEVKVLITNGKNWFFVPVKDDMRIVWERKGTPGKLTFETKYEKKFKIAEGNSVLVMIDGTKFFYGFIFTRDMARDGFVSITAYDQLRYLKAKETITYKNKSADQLVKIIASQFHLSCGKLADTSFKMSAIEEDTTLFDMIQNALDNTLMAKNKVYVFYDKAGKLRLTNVADMKVDNCLIDEETAEDYTYKTTIDENVYNQIKLIYENTEKAAYELYVVKSTENINNWGLLQYLEKIDNPDIGKLKAEAYLKLYNQKQRSLSISGVIGNTKVRAGSLVPVILKLADRKVANYMMVEKATHIFQNRQHKMDLILSGGDFSG